MFIQNAASQIKILGINGLTFMVHNKKNETYKICEL